MSKKIFTYSIFIIGIIIFLYPFIAKVIMANNSSIAVSKYESTVERLSEKEIVEKKEEANKHNEELYNDDVFKVNFNDSENSNVVSSINFLEEKNIIAYILIPKIDVSLPIYNGYSDDILLQGIGYMTNTSFPCGGPNTHSVLVGHSGLANAIFFDNIEKLSYGDKFYIKFLDEILTYQVTEIKTVLPDQTESLIIQEGKDLVTLVTCTPRYVNTYRLLVTGERIETSSEDIDKISNNNNYNVKQLETNKSYIFVAILILIIVILIVITIIIIKVKGKTKS